MTNLLVLGFQTGWRSRRISLEAPPTAHHIHRFMAGGKKRKRGPDQQDHQAPCPFCGTRFKDVLRHLNHRNSKCTGWFALPSDLTRSSSPQRLEFTGTIDDVPPPPPADDPEPTSNSTGASSQPLQNDFPNASKIYGREKSFIDRFNDDQYASQRVCNLYYPFADQEEWELGSFLLRSGMSMQKVDEFLKLKLVLGFQVFRCIVY